MTEEAKGVAKEACAGVVRAESKGRSSLGAGSEVGLALTKRDLQKFVFSNPKR